MDAESVIITKKNGIQIALNVGVGSPAVEIRWEMTTGHGGHLMVERGLDEAEGVALAVQILRAFAPAQLAEFKPIDFDETFDTDDSHDEANEVEITAVCWSSLQAQLSNGVIVPITTLIDKNGLDCEDVADAVTFVAGSDEQGWRVDCVSEYVALDETIKELTQALADTLVCGFDWDALEVLRKYSPELAETLDRVMGHTAPYSEDEREADNDVTGIFVRETEGGTVEDAAMGPVMNRPSSDFGTLGGNRGLGAGYTFPDRPLVDNRSRVFDDNELYAEVARGLIGGDVAGPQSEVVTINEDAHGLNITLDEWAKRS